MGIFSNIVNWLVEPLEVKDYTTTSLPVNSPDAIEEMLRNDIGGLPSTVSAVALCARVIAEGLALPPCHVVRQSDRGSKVALDHPLYYLLHDSPNDRQTSYEFREQIGQHLALNSNAHVWVNRSPRTQEILELHVCDPGIVTELVDPSKPFAPVRYFLWGNEVDARSIWHLKGPSWLSYRGTSTVNQARSAINLARHTETFGTALFTNGARMSGLVTVGGDATQDQIDDVRANFNKMYAGSANSHKVGLLTGDITYTPFASTANEAQFIEARKFQLGEICRFFRVSPTKIFHNDGSQSYASVEQAHMAHDQDTDAHWHARYMQSANKALFTDAERKQGLRVTLDNRAALRGADKDRMLYYNMGIAAGIFTRNEVRELENFDLLDDPLADALTPAVNLYGQPATEVTQPPSN